MNSMKTGLILMTFCLVFMAGVAGWTARSLSADHRYIRSLAERHEAESRYFDQKLDDMIQENKGAIYGDRRKEKADGSSTKKN